MSANSYLTSAFDLPLTYGQRLRLIMQDNHLSVSDMCRKLGYHSPTQLNRILSDEVSPALITKFHQQFMLIFDWLISPAEIRALSTSLQFSCMGQDAFLTRRSMYRMLFSPPTVSADTIPLLHVSGVAQAKHPVNTFSDLIALSAGYKKIDLMILGSAFDRLLPLFTCLSESDYPLEHLSIQHYFVMEENPAKLISQISALVPFLNAGTYTGAYCTETSPQAQRFIQQNPVALARFTNGKGQTFTTLFLAPLEGGLPVCRFDSDHLYAFYDQMLSDYRDQMRPIKSVYPFPKTMESLLALCQRDLFMEQNHASCFMRLDLCFHVLPLDVVMEAVDHGARMGTTIDDPLIQELMRVHLARYENVLTKREPTLFILTPQALIDFANTGHMSDHLFAMRDFTPAQRRAVLLPFIEALRKNDALSVHLLKDDALTPVGCFCAYDELGVQISSNHTAYNVADNHSEVFVGVPAFAHSFMEYCKNTLIPESCMTRDESIAFIERLAASISEDDV